MKLTRDHYEGTEFDMSKGLAAGDHTRALCSAVSIPWLSSGAVGKHGNDRTVSSAEPSTAQSTPDRHPIGGRFRFAPVRADTWEEGDCV